MARRRSPLTIAAIVLAVLVLVPVLALLLIPKDRIVREVAKGVESATGWRLEVQKTGVSLFPLAVRLEGLRLGGNPAYSDSSEIAIGSARVAVALRPLLSRRIQVSSVLLERPAIRLEAVRMAPGAPGRPGAPPAAPAKPGAAPLALTLSRLEARDGSLSFVDTTGFALLLDSLSLDLAVDASAGFERVAISGRFVSGRTSTILPPLPPPPGGPPPTGALAKPLVLGGLRTEGDLKLLYEPKTDALTISQGNVLVNALPASVTGTVSGLLKIPTTDLTITATDASVAELLSLVPDAVLAEKEKLRADGRVNVSARVIGPTWPPGAIQTTGAVSIVDGKFSYVGTPGTVDGLAGHVRFDANRIDVDSLTARFEGSPFRISGTIVNPADPIVNLSMKGKLPLDLLAKWPAFASMKKLGGTVSADVRAEGPARVPKAMQLNGTIELNKVTAQPATWAAPLEEVSGLVRLVGTRANLERLDGRLGSSDFHASGTVRDPLATPSANLAVTAKFLDLDGLIRIAGGAAAPAQPAGAAAVAAPLLLPELPPFDATLTIRADSLVAQAIPFRDARGDIRLVDRTLRMNLTADRIGVPGSPLSGVKLDMTVKDRKATGEFTAAEVVVNKIPVREIRSDVSISRDGVVELTKAQARAFDGNLSGDVRIEFAGAEPKYTFAVHGEGLEMNEFLSRLTPAKNLLYGTLKLDGKFDGAGLTAQQAMAKLTADGTAAAVNGKMVPNPVLLEIATLLGIPQLQEINFRTFYSGFKIENGRVRMDDTEMKAEGSTWNVAGSMGFDGTIDYRIGVVLASALADQVVKKLGDPARYLVNPQGELPVDLILSGNAKKPKVSIDLTKAASRVRAGAAADAARALGLDEKAATDPKAAVDDAIEKAAGGLLDGFRKKTQPAPTPAPTPAPAPPPAAPPAETLPPVPPDSGKTG